VPALGTPERATVYKWLFWMSNTLQATIMTSVYPERWVEVPDESVVAQLKRQAQRRVGGQLELLDAQLRASGGPWVLGEAFSVLDPLAFMLCLWTRNFDEAIAAPARLRPALGPYLKRVLSRSSVQRVLADEGFRAPSV
jgi:glutathione S-transferase